jgi:hypothetical protein
MLTLLVMIHIIVYITLSDAKKYFKEFYNGRDEQKHNAVNR